MAMKKRWLAALEEAALRETVRLPWARGDRSRPADTDPSCNDGGAEGAPA
ncbi:hypothetical protein ACRDNQ_12215 [Palleronia sp. KMU-117]